MNDARHVDVQAAALAIAPREFANWISVSILRTFYGNIGAKFY